MNISPNRAVPKKPRIVLTESDLQRLFEINATESAAILAKRTGLPYMLIYNLVHRRVRTVSQRHYKLLFGTSPPNQAPLKVDGRRFRAMVDLWVYLNNGPSRADLYRELFGLSRRHKIDHRIFSGKISTVDGRLEHAMQQKFLQAGVDEPILKQWLDEFTALSPTERIPYANLRPILVYLEQKLGLHPTSVLKQSVTRYESGMLKSVSRKIAEHAEDLKRAAEKALQTDASPDTGKLRESLLGGKTGYTLYADIRKELQFTIKAGGRGAKFFLGRSLWTYQQGKARYIANWRIQRILEACDAIIRQNPGMAISVLPPSRRRMHIQGLSDVLMARVSQLLSRKEGLDLEKQILRPSRLRDEYSNPTHGFTPFEMAPRVLGMRRGAFDLMVTKNCEIFRSVGRFSQRWYLSDLYLRELSGKKDFRLILEKYERMAKNRHRRKPTDTCMV